MIKARIAACVALLIAAAGAIAFGGGEIVHLSDYNEQGYAVIDGPIPGPEIPVWPHLQEPGEWPDAPTISVVSSWEADLSHAIIQDHWIQAAGGSALLIRNSEIGWLEITNCVVETSDEYCAWIDGSYGRILLQDSSFTTLPGGGGQSQIRGPYGAEVLVALHSEFTHTETTIFGWMLPTLRIFDVDALVLLLGCDFHGAQLNFGGYDGAACASSHPVGEIWIIGCHHDTRYDGLIGSPITVREADALVLAGYDLWMPADYPGAAIQLELGTPIYDLGGNTVNGVPLDLDLHVQYEAPCS